MGYGAGKKAGSNMQRERRGRKKEGKVDRKFEPNVMKLSTLLLTFCTLFHEWKARAKTFGNEVEREKEKESY